jgi:hypothetical protein
MPSVVRHDKTLQLIEVVHTGTLTAKGLQESTDEGVALNVETGVNSILIDAAHLESAEYFLGVFDLPQQYAEGGLSRQACIALVMPKKTVARKIAQFYDDVCVNRGWTVKPFETRDAAVEWLTTFESSRLLSS